MICLTFETKNVVDSDLGTQDADNNLDLLADKSNLISQQAQMVMDQHGDASVNKYFDETVSEQEYADLPTCYYVKSGLLMRKWRPPDVPADEDWRVFHQIVVPVKYRNDIMVLAHEFPTGGHMGVNKTHKRILQYFYWSQIRKDVSKYCRTCHTCQLVGKPNQGIKKAPLYPIPAFDQPFARLIIDCVGPLPRTRSGNNYLLT
jgi:hypothetical protein